MTQNLKSINDYPALPERADLTITTEKASKYLQQLCRHFARKVHSEWSEQEGTVYFPVGVCQLKAEEKSLSFQCSSENKEKLEVHKGIIDSHINLVAKKESIAIQWTEQS